MYLPHATFPPLWAILAWIVLPLTFWFVDPKLNVNWVRGHGSGERRLPPLARLGLLMFGFPALVYLPTHLLLQALFG